MPPGKRGRPPKVKEVVDYVPMANDSGLVADEKNLMKPSEAAKLSAKNARTMVKMMQLIEVMSRPGADNLDTDGKVRAKIEKYRKRMNRRLRKLAMWSDERVEFRKINLTEKRRKLDSAYKSIPYQSAVGFANYPRTSLTESGAYTDDTGKEVMDPSHGHRLTSEARFCLGSVQNYADYFMKRVEAGEKSGSTVVNFRVPDPIAPRPAVGVNVVGDAEAIKARFKASVINSHKYITREENHHALGDQEKAKRKRVDNDHRYTRLRELGLM